VGAEALAFAIIDGAIAFEPEPVLQTADDLRAQENGGDERGRPSDERDAAATQGRRQQDTDT